LIYCTNVKACLIEAFGTLRKENNWRLFKDSLKASLNAVLLYIGRSVPIAHSTDMTETIENIKLL